MSSAYGSWPSRVFRPDELPAKDRGGGARTVPFVTAARGGTTFLNGMTVFSAGASIAHHQHNVAESVMVIEGDAIVDIDGERIPLRRYDTTFVPANIPHHFENASDSVEMRILWVYGSLDADRKLLITGERGRVDAESTVIERVVRPVNEIVDLWVLDGHDEHFEGAVAQAAPLFQQADGARIMSLDRSIDDPRHYRLTVGWDSVQAHTVGFRESAAFGAWRALVAEHLAEPPQAEHFATAFTGF